MTKKHAINKTNSEPTAVYAPSIELNTEGANVPTELMVLPAGRVIGRDGRYWYNDRPEEIVKNFNDDKVDLPMDYEHGSEWDSYDGAPVRASGWVKSLYIVDGAVFAKVEWTPSAKQMIADKEYRYISPAFWHDKNFIIFKLTSIGLVHKPNLVALPALNKQNRQSKTPNPKGDKMNEEEYLALCKELGLKPDASNESVMKALNAMKKDAELALNKASTPPDIKLFAPRAELVEAKAELNKLQSEKTKKEEAARVVAVNSLIDDAVKTGKIMPAVKDQYLSLCSTEKGFKDVKELIDGIKASNSSLSGDTKLPNVDGKSLSEMDKAICKNMGISHEEFLATNDE
ncbi:MAG: hypothetical protein HRU28_00030 [Rhizobiales bacterium]|nr:hypothetical protein [Hyphomicrobiales bacterium]